MIKTWKKGIALLLTAALAAGALTGCAKDGGNTVKEAEQKAQNQASGTVGGAKGRYVEEKMETPWQENEWYLHSYQDAQGNPVVFTMYEENGAVKQYCYDGDWQQEDCVWANEICARGESIFLLRDGADGSLYLLTEEDAEEESGEENEEENFELEPIRWHLYQYADGKTEELEMPFLTVEGQQDEVFYPYYFGVSQSGDLAVVALGSEDIVVYDRESKKQKAALPKHQMYTSEDYMYWMEGDTLSTLADNDKDVVFYDTQTGGEKGRIALGEQKRGCLAGKDGQYYLVNEDGVFTFYEDGDLIEQIFDGSLGEMSAAESTATAFLPGSGEDFYVVYRKVGGKGTMMYHYVYDENAVAVADQTFCIYGLREDARIKEAVHVFQKEHPEIKVTYDYAFEEYGRGNTEDTVKALNTELLGGQGADVLALDGLPAESYAEKGILADLGGLGERLAKEGEILEAVLSGGVKDGMTYGIPTGMRVPLMFGSKELCQTFESVDALERFLKTDQTAKVTGVNAYSTIAWMLFGLDYETIVGETGDVDQEKIVRILKLARQIGGNNEAEWVKAMQEDWVTAREEGYDFLRDPFTLSSCECYYDETCIGIQSVDSLYTLAEVCDIRKAMPQELQNIKGYYIPKGMLGINQATKNRELAEAFIETVLRDEVQRATEGSLPVCPESLERLGENAEKMKDFSMSTSGWDDKMHSFGYPAQEELTPYLALFQQVEKPLKIDTTIQEAFLDVADRYFEDGISEEEAAREFARMVDTYMAE